MSAILLFPLFIRGTMNQHESLESPLTGRSAPGLIDHQNQNMENGVYNTNTRNVGCIIRCYVILKVDATTRPDPFPETLKMLAVMIPTASILVTSL